MNLHQPRRSTYRPLRLLAASITLALGACAMTAPEALPDDPPFAPGWQEHTSPLFNVGPGPTAGSTVWLVSGLLPRGHYAVIARDGDRARLIDGHAFEVEGGVNRELRLILPFSTGSLEALDARWVVARAPTKAPAKTP